MAIIFDSFENAVEEFDDPKLLFPAVQFSNELLPVMSTFASLLPKHPNAPVQFLNVAALIVTTSGLFPKLPVPPVIKIDVPKEKEREGVVFACEVSVSLRCLYPLFVGR
jgi:hypothetical protein